MLQGLYPTHPQHEESDCEGRDDEKGTQTAK